MRVKKLTDSYDSGYDEGWRTGYKFGRKTEKAALTPKKNPIFIIKETPKIDLDEAFGWDENQEEC